MRIDRVKMIDLRWLKTVFCFFESYRTRSDIFRLGTVLF